MISCQYSDWNSRSNESYLAATNLEISIFALVAVSTCDVGLAAAVTGELIAGRDGSVVELDCAGWITLAQLAAVLFALRQSVTPVS